MLVMLRPKFNTNVMIKVGRTPWPSHLLLPLTQELLFYSVASFIVTPDFSEYLCSLHVFYLRGMVVYFFQMYKDISEEEEEQIKDLERTSKEKFELSKVSCNVRSLLHSDCLTFQSTDRRLF